MDTPVKSIDILICMQVEGIHWKRFWRHVHGNADGFVDLDYDQDIQGYTLLKNVDFIFGACVQKVVDAIELHDQTGDIDSNIVALVSGEKRDSWLYQDHGILLS